MSVPDGLQYIAWKDFSHLKFYSWTGTLRKRLQEAVTRYLKRVEIRAAEKVGLKLESDPCRRRLETRRHATVGEAEERETYLPHLESQEHRQ